VFTDDVDPDPPSEDRGKFLVGCGRLDKGKLAVGEGAQPRARTETPTRAQNEYVVRGAAGIGVMRADPQSRPVVHQAVEHVRASWLVADMTRTL